MAYGGMWRNHVGIYSLEEQVIEMVILLESVNNDVGGGGKQKTQSELHNNEQKTLLKIQIML